MVYLLAAVFGFGSGWLIGRLTAYLENRIYNVRVKEVKEELTHNKLDTEPPCTA